MNTGYLIYQAERPRSAAEQRQVDAAHGELARSASRRWRALTAPLRALRPAGRLAGRRAGLAARYQATEYQATEYQVAECPAAERPAAERPAAERPAGCQAEDQAGESLAGRTA